MFSCFLIAQSYRLAALSCWVAFPVFAAETGSSSPLEVPILNEQSPASEPILQFLGDADAIRSSLTPERSKIVDALAQEISSGLADGAKVQLIFVCTHNSRRSQFAQVWAQTAAAHFGFDPGRIECFSGGTEVTACNPRTVASLGRAGFAIEKVAAEVGGSDNNPVYHVSFAADRSPIVCSSKVYDTAGNPTSGFIAVMCCDHADENCPVVRGSLARIAMFYDDPKVSDDTPAEAATYDHRNRQIAREIWAVMEAVVAAGD